MSDKCCVRLTKGKHKGMLCYEAKSQCRHIDKVCFCGDKFKYDFQYKRHRLTCVSQQSESSGTLMMGKIMDELEHLRGEVGDLQEKVKQIEETPKIQVINWNIVIGDNFYQELSDKLGGKECAIKYLAGVAANNNLIDIIQTLYLERREPSEYPIACRDMHFKFVNSLNQLIDDKDGVKLCNMLGNSIQNAMLLANNDYISRKTLEDREIDDESHAQIAETQKYVVGLPGRMRKNGFLKELSDLTDNPQHEFFAMAGVTGNTVGTNS